MLDDYFGSSVDRKNDTRAYIGAILREGAHYLAHILAGLVFVSLWYRIDSNSLILIVIFSLLPDFDTHVGLAHRTASHSIAAIFGVALLGYASGGTSNDTRIATLAYASHVAVDLLHGLGVQLLWPATKRFFSISQNVQPVYILAGGAMLLTIISNEPHPPLALPPTPTPMPTRAIPSIATRTPQPTPTPTPTPTRTPTPTPDYWRIEEARLQYEQALSDANFTCRIYGERSQRCTNARYRAEIQRAQYCRLAGCPAPTPTP